MAIDVVIPTWNGASVLEKCLESLTVEKTPHTVIVVDNGSEDETVRMVRKRFPAVSLVPLSENFGFGVATNRGVAAGSAEVIVLLNNDACVRPGFLAAISAPLLSATRTGMVSGVLLLPGTDLIDGAGVTIDRGLAGFAFMRSMATRALAYPLPGLVGPSGGAAAFRRVAFDEVGGFDEQIFAYCEDVDLSLRMHAAGWSCVLAPSARADHLGSATLGSRTVRQVAISSRSRGYVLGRWRVGAIWTGTELLIGFLDCLLLRSPAPLTQRLRGVRQGRRLPGRTLPEEVLGPAMGWWASLRRRFDVTRSYEMRSAR